MKLNHVTISQDLSHATTPHQLEKSEHIVDIKLDLPMVAYVKFLIILIELQKLLSRELKCMCSKTTTVLLV